MNAPQTELTDEELIAYVNERLDNTSTNYVVKADKVKANPEMKEAIEKPEHTSISEVK